MGQPLEIEYLPRSAPHHKLRDENVIQDLKEAIREGDALIIVAHDGERDLDPTVFTLRTGLINASTLDLKELASIRDKLFREH